MPVVQHNSLAYIQSSPVRQRIAPRSDSHVVSITLQPTCSDAIIKGTIRTWTN